MTIKNLVAPPTGAEVDRWADTVVAAHTADLPGVPAPSRLEIAGRLRVPPARGRAALWTADGGAGVAALLLFTEEANRTTAYLDVLAVHPDARRRGTGTALWRTVREELLADGRTSVATTLDLGGPGQAFAQSLGFENVLPMAWYVQDLPRDPAAADAAEAAAPVPPGYALLSWHGLVSDDWAGAVAAAHGAMQDAPAGDVDVQIEAWTPQVLHAAHRLILDRGGELTTVAAVTEAGEVAAYTELVLPDPDGVRALQYDTVVVPAHRGRGLGRAVKAHMQALTARRHPRLRQIATTVADENIPMRAVNEALGYRRERGTAYFQLTLDGAAGPRP
ncbi:GNAT family N-acetyltransferase [Streptomyces sp. NPDC091268]|uniref:GNAT family N-acetyltransferase n=1 Tax=Streptomyces sp. NPDC091268 TaxID=3365979 RepID=UPI00380E0E81